MRALLLALLLLFAACQTTTMDPTTGRVSVRSLLMEHKSVCIGQRCTTCARGKRAAVLGMLAPAVIVPELGLPAMAIGLGIEAVSKDDGWCSGWPEVLEVPHEKPTEPAPPQVFRWTDRECLGFASLDPDVDAVWSMEWCPPGVEF